MFNSTNLLTYCRESVRSGSQSMLRPKKNEDSIAVESTFQANNSLSSWSGNADLVSLSDTVDTSKDKLASQQCLRYSIICSPISLFLFQFLLSLALHDIVSGLHMQGHCLSMLGIFVACLRVWAIALLMNPKVNIKSCVSRGMAKTYVQSRNSSTHRNKNMHYG